MLTILDVSSAQGPAIRWPTVAANGRTVSCLPGGVISAVYVKLTEGATGLGSVDLCGPLNVRGAAGEGLPCGVYHFLSALSDPRDQAHHFLEQLGALDVAPTLPPMLDLERGAGVAGRIPPVEYAIAWLEAVEAELGVVPLIYTGAWVSAADHMAQHPEFARHPGWVAAYGALRTAPPICAPWGAWGTPTGPAGWQWTSAGHVPGIGMGVDLSRFWKMPGDDAHDTDPAPPPAP